MRDCEELKEMEGRDLVYWKNGNIYLTETRSPLAKNFGNGGVKAKFEEAEAKKASAMYYSATAGVRLEDSPSQSTFWQRVVSSAQKQKLKMDDLHAAGDSVRDITGWDAPVDIITAYTQAAEGQVCDYEVVVEEKRKRPDEETISTKKHDTRESRKKEMETKADKGKPGPSFRLMSDIEKDTDLKRILEMRILDSRLELTLREVLGIAKKEFHDEIIDIVRRKKQVNEQVKQMDPKVAYEVVSNESPIAETHHALSKKIILGDARNLYTHKCWARATTEHYVKIGDIPDPVVALIDHGSEINIMSADFYKKGKWPIDTQHGWRVKAATSITKDLFGACPNVKVAIGDIEVDQHFFVQEGSTYPIILGQPYITSVRMETKVLDDGSAYAKIRSHDGRRSVQFMTVRPNHERNREELRDHPTLMKRDNDQVFY